MKPNSFVLTLLLSAALSIAAAFFVGAYLSSGTQLAPRTIESRLEQVKRTGVLRCGYTVDPPFLTKDANAGKLGGPFYELAEEIGRQLKLKIEWAGEAGPGQMLTDLASNRYDMICSPYSETPGRAREADFTNPVFYWSVYLYVRKDDRRFDENRERANKPDIKFAALDGHYSTIAVDENFPSAGKVSLPELSSAIDLFMMVATKKADAVIADPYTFADYAAANPDVLRPAGGKPLRLIADGLPIPANEPALKAMINTTLAYLHDSGFIDKTLKKYDAPIKLIRVAKPYSEEGTAP